MPGYGSLICFVMNSCEEKCIINSCAQHAETHFVPFLEVNHFVVIY